MTFTWLYSTLRDRGGLCHHLSVPSIALVIGCARLLSAALHVSQYWPCEKKNTHTFKTLNKCKTLLQQRNAARPSANTLLLLFLLYCVFNLNPHVTFCLVDHVLTGQIQRQWNHLDHLGRWKNWPLTAIFISKRFLINAFSDLQGHFIHQGNRSIRFIDFTSLIYQHTVMLIK